VSIGTSTSYENNVTVAVSTGDEASLSSTTIETTLVAHSPDLSDGGDGLSASAGVDALALGDDTFAAGSISGVIVEGETSTQADVEASAVAVGEASDGDAAALAGSYAVVSNGPEVVVTTTITTLNSQQDANGSAAVSTSTSNVVAYDVHTSTGNDVPGLAEDEAGRNPSWPTDPDAWDLDGNLALIEIDAAAIADDSLVVVEAFALTIEDELSISVATVDLAVN
jgi:hypothetical protein